ncbi:MAG: hypothetical protein ICV67_06540 [Thermoleophilia bacterium]|nr:hypothetical protein [Thermoleophilia bacterium]
MPLFADCSDELEAVARVTDELRLLGGRVLLAQAARERELLVLLEGELDRLPREVPTIADEVNRAVASGSGPRRLSGPR